MPIRILTLKELPSDSEAKDVLLDQLAFGATFSVIRERKKGPRKFPYPDHTGLYAVDENNDLLSRVEVHRVPFRTREGLEQVSCISSVATRPDAAGRGLATRLLEEAHARERKAGINFSLLWTRSSWIAHRIYERLGYQDILSFPYALKYIPRSFNAKTKARLFPASKKDAQAIVDMHDTMTKNWYGFTPRREYWLQKTKGWHVLQRNKDPLAYLLLIPGTGNIACGEILASKHVPDELMLSSLEEKAKGKWLVLYGPAVKQNLSERGYAISSKAWGVLMAARLDAKKARNLTHTLGADDSKFACFGSDGF